MKDKDNLVVINCKKDEKKVSVGLVALLEELLKQAEEGELQEMVAITYSVGEGYQQLFAVNPELYDTTLFGEIIDCGHAYREYYHQWDIE